MFYPPISLPPSLRYLLNSLVVTVLLLHANWGLAQMNYWVTPPNAIDFTQTPTTAAPIPNAPSNPYIVSNGAYDADGNLLFYVVDGNVYKPNGSWAGQLPSTSNFALEFISPEMAIVPIPGECYRFNIIYLLAGGPPSGAALFFTQVDASNGDVVMCDPPNPLVDAYPGSITGSLTVSKDVNHLGGRWMYVVSVVQLKHTASTPGQGALQVFDGSGRMVYSQELSIQVGEQQHGWNMENQAAGLYHYRLISPSGSFSGRFVKVD